MNTPKIVIYMSCYNHEAYVREAMDSVINQTYQNWELYVVNDASTDNTGKILETYKDDRINYYDFKENTAFTGAANFLQELLMTVEAKYITTFSSDDKWENDKLQKQVEVLETHPEYKCCFTWDKIIFESEDMVYQGREDYSHKKNRDRYEWIYHFWHNGNCMNACSALMNKEVFYELGRMNENYRQLGDYRLWLRLACKYPFYVLEEELTYYRRHNDNLSRVSIDVLSRHINEEHWILWEFINEIDNDTFYRAFYKELPYRSYDAEEDFLTAKFILLINKSTRVSQQAAIDFYYKNCGNQRFLEVLEKKYNFKPQNFLSLAGTGGLLYQMLGKTDMDESSYRQEIDFIPAFIFGNAIELEKINADNLADYSYAALFDFAAQMGTSELFDEIVSWVNQTRDARFEHQKNRKVVFMIGEESAFNISEELSDVIENELNECYYSIIPTRSHMFELDDEFGSTHGKLSDPEIKGVDHVSTYDAGEHCLTFLKDADVIYYIDCIYDNYGCFDMMSGYSLAVEQNCILRFEHYDAVTRETNLLKLFTKVFTYE